MPPPVNNLSFDATSAEKAIASVIASFKSYNATLNEVSAAYTKFSAAGDVVEAKIRGITAAGEKFQVKLKDEGNGLEVLAGSATKTTAALQRLAAAKKAATGGLEYAKALPKVQQALPVNNQINNLKKAQFDSLLADSLKGVKSGDVSAKEFNNIFRLVRAGNKQMLTGVLEDTRQSIIRVVKEYDKINEAATKANSRAQKARFASQVQGSITSNFGTLNPKASEAAANRVTNAIRTIMATLKQGEISWKEYNNVLSETKNKTGKIFEVGGEATIQKQLQTIILEYNRATTAANKFSAAQKQTTRRNTAADVAGNKLKSSFDLSGLDSRALERAHAQIAKIQNLLSSGKINYNQFRNVFRSIETGARTSFKGAEEAVRASMSRIKIEIEAAKNPVITLGKAFNFFRAQIAFDVFSRVISSFKGMAGAAADFQQRIALIQTISQDSSLTFSDWSANILKVSNELGRPAEEVASAAYDLLSNQITKGSDTFGALKTAGDFARSTNSGLEDSVNLLSSAINAFKLSAADAERVSAQFFTAIDLGRLKASDLANTFGRVATTAQSLGVNLQETLALLTVLTRQGIQPDTAQTLLTNVFQKLLKPTKELQSVYDELGVSSGELFVKTYGIVGALQKLQQVAGGSQAKLSAFFNEIRSFQGGNILTDRLGEVSKDIKEIENAFSNNVYDNAKALTKDNFGQQFKEQLTEVTNYFKSEFEDTLLRGVINLTNSFGGLANIVKTLIGPFFALTGAVVTFLAAAKVGALIASFADLVAAIQLGAEAAVLFGTALAVNPVTWIAAAAAGLVYFTYQAHQASAAWAQVPEEIRKANEEYKAAYLKAVDENLNNKKISFVDQSKSQQAEALKYLAAYGQELAKVRAAEAATAEELKKGLNNELNVLITNAKKVGTELSQAMTKAANSAKEAAKAMRDLQSGSFSRSVTRGEKRNEVNQNNARTIAELNGQDPELAANRVDKSDYIFNQQLDYLNKRKNAAFKAGDVSELTNVFRDINSLMDQIATKTQKSPIFNSLGQHTGKYLEKFKYPDYQGNIDQEHAEQIAMLDEVRKKKLADVEVTRQQLETNKRLVETIETLAKSLEKFNPFDSKGKLKDGYKDVADVLTELIGLQNQFNEAANKLGENGSTPSMKSYKEQLERVKEQLEKQKESVGKETGTERQQDAISKAQEGISNGTDAATRGMDATIAKAKEAEEAWVNAFNKYRESAGQLLQHQVDNHDNTFPLKYLNNFSNKLKGNDEQHGLPATEALKGMDFAVQAGDIAKARQELEKFEQIYRQNRELETQVTPGGQDKLGATAQNEIDRIKNQLLAVEQAAKAKASANQAVEQQLNGLQQSGTVIDGLKGKFGELGGAAQNFGAQAAGGINEASAAVSNLLNEVNQAISVLNSLKSEAASLPASSGKSSSKSSEGTSAYDAAAGYERLGGMVQYAKDGFLGAFASGAFKKGSDTLPIMANRNEILINEESSRRFYPQLMAINRGIDPSRGSKPVNHTVNLGGITVNGGDTGKQTVNEIVNGINRAARRGTIKAGR